MSCTVAVPKPRRKCPRPLQLPTEAVVDQPPSPVRLPIREIFPGLLISGYSSATDAGLLQTHRVTHILNLAGDAQCPNLFPDRFVYRTVKLTDSPDFQLTSCYAEVLQFIHAARSAGGRVLVHCAMGKSRAPSIGCAYAMWALNLSATEAFALIQQKQKLIEPNLGFIAQLQELSGCSPAWTSAWPVVSVKSV